MERWSLNEAPSWSFPPLAIANQYHDQRSNQPQNVRYRLILVRASDLDWLQKDQHFFFSSSLADVALWLGPYMSISGKTSLCTRTKAVWKCRQITTTTTTHNPARRPANPPARLAFRQEKQQTRQTKGAGAQTKTTTKKICQRTQWFDHCIVLKNMRK